jgi:hypothetical protein
LRANNYDWKKVDRSLWSVPDEIHYQLWQPRTYHAWSRLTNIPVYHDEIAFYSNLYVWMEMKPSSGLEGKSLQLSGFYIVGWKNGEVTRVPTDEVRVLYSASGSGVNVFPGMSEFSTDLPLVNDAKAREEARNRRTAKK